MTHNLWTFFVVMWYVTVKSWICRSQKQQNSRSPHLLKTLYPRSKSEKDVALVAPLRTPTRNSRRLIHSYGIVIKLFLTNLMRFLANTCSDPLRRKRAYWYCPPYWFCKGIKHTCYIFLYDTEWRDEQVERLAVSLSRALAVSLRALNHKELRATATVPVTLTHTD